jgi:hypothetical protein
MNFHTDTDVRECDDVREELQPYILTQYSGSPTIVQLLSDFRDNIDPQADINLFIEKVMNIDTAEGIGLDILGRIIGMARVVRYGGETITLTDNLYRRLLMYKAFANISDSTMATMNKMLNLLFGENLMFAKNLIVESQNGDEYYNSFPMHVRFTALRDLTEEEKLLFALGATLNLSAGVGWSLVVNQSRVFGFKNSNLMPFNCGVFTSYNTTTEGD